MEHFTPTPTKNLFYIDWIEFPSRFLGNIKKLKLSLSEKNILQQLSVLFKKNYDLNNAEHVEKILYRFILRYKLINHKLFKLLKKSHPKLIIVVDGYTLIHKNAIENAKKLNIPTIELQHGTMGRYHIAYNFYRKYKLVSFPDYFFVWGEFWKKNSRLPIDKRNIKITGFPYLENKIREIKFNNNRKNIVVISQGPIGDKLAEMILDCVNHSDIRQYRIIFKLHPAEIIDAKERYAKLYNQEKVWVVDDKKYSLYDLFAISDFQIGVFSTALLEGLAFGLKTIIVKLPGWEYMKDLENKSAEFVETKEELVEAIINYNDKLCNDSVINEFWETNSINNINNEIQKIINWSNIN